MTLGLIDRLLNGQKLKSNSLDKICYFLGIELTDDRNKLEKHFKSILMGARKELLEKGNLQNKKDHWILSRYYRSKRLVEPKLLLDRAKQGLFKRKIDLIVDNIHHKNALTLPAKSQQIWLYDDPIKVSTSTEIVKNLCQIFTVYNDAYSKPLCFKNKATQIIGYYSMTWIKYWLEYIAMPIALSKFDEQHQEAAENGIDLVAQVEYRVKIKKTDQNAAFPSLSGWTNKFSLGDKLDVNEILSDHEAYLKQAQWKSGLYLDEPELLKLYIQEINGL